MASTNPARGTRDFLPADVRKREYVIGVIRSVYESFGFEPLETPAVENIETLLGKYGEEGTQLTFRVLKRGEKFDEALARACDRGGPAAGSDLADLALRYDLTVPLARVVANRGNDLPKFFKRYQIQPVWRADRPARGRYREFYQCDVDAIGSSSMTVEAELISAVSQILTRLGFADFVIRINHRDVLRGLLDAAGTPAEKHSDALVALDKLDKIGAGGVQKEFEERGISGAGRLLDLFAGIDPADNAGNLKKVADFISGSCVGKAGIRSLDEIFTAADAGKLRFDPSLARGLSYYTGAIMEINVPDLAGSLGGGGRYDGLIGMFGKEQIPACGFSLGLERILFVMDERGMFPDQIAASRPADAMVAMLDEKLVRQTLEAAAKMRSGGIRVTVYPQADKLGKQFKYADQLGVPFVCVLGDAEASEGRIRLKDMSSGEESLLTPSEAAETIIRRLA